LLGSPLPLTHSLSIPSTGTSILESTMSRSGGVERDWNSADEVVSDAEQEDGRLASISDLIKSRISTRANSYDYECNDDEIRALLISHPEVATSCTTEELTRLLQCKEVTVDTVRILYEACPNAFRDLRSYDTLAYLALRPEKVDVACYLADVCPSLIIPTDAEAREAGSSFTTPLHLACERKTQNWHLVKKICEKNPDAILKKDRIGCTPIHTGRNGRSDSNEKEVFIAELLAKTKPQVLMVQSNTGYTPLHHAVSRDSEKIATMFLEMCPAAAGVRRSNGCFPLHDYVSSNSKAFSLDFLSSLIQAYPPAARASARVAFLPLPRVFCSRTRATAGAVRLLLEAYPAASRTPTRNRELPLHCALRQAHRFVSSDCIALLIEANPGACVETNGDGQTPMHVLLQLTHERADLLKMLLERSLKPLAMRARVARTIHLAHLPVALDSATPFELIRHMPPYAQETESFEILRAFDSIGNCERNRDADKRDIIAALELFHDMNWSKGVGIILDRYPCMVGDVVSDVHSATVPTALSFIGRHCPLSTMFSALKAFPLVVQNGGYDGYGEDETDSSSCRRAKKQRM